MTWRKTVALSRVSEQPPPPAWKGTTLNQPDLAQEATELLARLVTDALTGTAHAAADRLFDLVSARLMRRGQSAVVDAFQRSPSSPAARAGLAQRLASELADEQFRHSVQICVDQSRPRSDVRITQQAGRDSFAAGRDQQIDQSKRTTKNHFGGILIAAVAIVALIALGFGAKAVVANFQEPEAPPLDANSTCAEFLRADSQTQVAVMKDLYLAAGHADRAGDPFILQNATYSCGQAPNMTLGTLAK
jgi:hypothetical protein